MTGAFFIPISIHSTTRVETLSSAPLLRASHRFQSTPPRGWRPQTGGRGDGCGDFNPLHHEGGDPVEVLYPNGVIISIHSTTRVETASPCKSSAMLPISIHSTTRVETYRPALLLQYLRNFNPLHHEGGDLYLLCMAQRIAYFNPLHHEGGDSNTTQ